MALTGLGLIGFVIAHLIGNLQVFAGPEAINSYAQTLKDLGPLLWVARGGLIVLFVTHLTLALQLNRTNQMARPIAYAKADTIKATLTSRTMVLSGLLILLYVIYHLLHFTIHIIDPSYTALLDAQGRHDVYQMIIAGFSHPVITTTYLLAMFVLAAHLHHGASSVFQTLGLNNGKYRPITSLIGPALAFLVFVGYGSIPVGVMLGWIN